MNKKIGVDLDEVLAESIDYSLGFYDYKLNSKPISRDDITNYHIHEITKYNISREDSIDWFRNAMKADVDLIIQPVNGALEKLLEFKNRGYSLNIVTARDGDVFSEYTRSWVEKYYKDIFDIILFANNFTTRVFTPKSVLCRQNNLSTMIEDSPVYALDLAKNGIKTFLLEKPWNITSPINHPNIIRVKSWDEID